MVDSPTSKQNPVAALEAYVEQLRAELKKWELILKTAKEHSPPPDTNLSELIKPGEFTHKKIIDAVVSALRKLPDVKRATVDELLEALRVGGCKLSKTRNPSRELAHLTTALTFNNASKTKKLIEFDKKHSRVTLLES